MPTSLSRLVGISFFHIIQQETHSLTRDKP